MTEWTLPSPTKRQVAAASKLGRKLEAELKKVSAPPTHKVCNSSRGGCNTEKAIAKYHRRFTNKDGYATICRDCTARRRRERGWR